MDTNKGLAVGSNDELGPLIQLLRAVQSHFGASRRQCDSPGRVSWDTIELAISEIERLRGIVPSVLEELNDSLCAENEALRRLLAVRVAGALLYTDDGELSDGTQHPSIDFKRDSADDINKKLRQRGRANYERSLEADKLLFKA